MGSQVIKDVVKSKLWKEFKRTIGNDFIRVLEHHIARVAGMPLDELVLLKPIEFKKLFIQVFGFQGWSVFINVMLNICREKSFNKEVVYKWFDIEEEFNQTYIY
ncbi:MAG: hypothetical protein DRJ38_06745 [Thermoprotei archaeon]|nr:MAG: hypothetical protein DRJ38_06745 [Thermoprotei archaeon]